jgi:hypothetical protein
MCLVVGVRIVIGSSSFDHAPDVQSWPWGGEEVHWHPISIAKSHDSHSAMDATLNWIMLHDPVSKRRVRVVLLHLYIEGDIISQKHIFQIIFEHTYLVPTPSNTALYYSSGLHSDLHPISFLLCFWSPCLVQSQCCLFDPHLL